MADNEYGYILSNHAVVFSDTLTNDNPYVTKKPRDHESIFFVTKGNLLYEKDGVKKVVEKGQVGYIQRGSMDKSRPFECSEVSYIAINFSFDKESDFPKPTLPFSTVCSKSGIYKYESLFNEALKSYIMKSPGYKMMSDGITLQIIGMIYNEYKTDIRVFEKVKKIEKAVELMTKSYNETELTISALADYANMSEKNFRRLFFDIYNKTPYAYLQEFRIEKSKTMLRYTNKSISDIAIQCGFSDVYSFSHCFKKHIGASPSKYRR